MPIEVGDPIDNGRLFVVSISDDRRVYKLRSRDLGDAAQDFEVEADTNATEAQVRAALAKVGI